jgi:hypothetical protein
VAIEPSPELIDVLWGSYLATGSDQPITRIIKLLPLAKDKDSVENLTTGSAAKFTLASNAVRDLRLLAILKREVKNQPDAVAAVLNEVIETAETVDTARMRKESLAAIDELKQRGPDTKRELTGWGQVGQGALAMVRGRRRGLFRGAAVYVALDASPAIHLRCCAPPQR